MLPLRNYRNYVLGEKLPDLGWRFCKTFSNVVRVTSKKQELYTWMSYGSDCCCSPDEISLILQFLRNLHCPYLSESNLAFADQNGVGVIKDLWSNGSLRDQLYRVTSNRSIVNLTLYRFRSIQPGIFGLNMEWTTNVSS